MRRRTTSLLTLAATASMLAACGSGSEDDPTGVTLEPTTEPTTVETTDEPTTDEPTTDDPTSQAPSDEEGDGPAWPEGTDDQDATAFDAELLFTDLRVAEHDGYDRLVLEFEGEGEPGWAVRYVTEAVQEGSGNPIEIDADALLQVAATHTMTSDMDGYYDGPLLLEPDLEAIDEVAVDGSFEGYTTVYLGLDDVAVFRVFTLTDPSRLVVDVQHD